MSDGPTVTVGRAAELLHCSRAQVFVLLGRGVLERAPRYGRATVIVTASVLRAAVRAPAPAVPKRTGRSKRARVEAEAAAVRRIKVEE